MTGDTTLELLRRFESRNITFMEPDGSWPIVWKRARGVHVWDVEGKKYLDLTAAFGVAAAGHANPAVVRAGRKQMGELLHAMGDVHPHPLKADLARELSRVTFQRWKAGSAKTIFTNSGFEAVEAALKTANLATGKPRIIAFEGAYHGLGYGALNATHRSHFHQPFRKQLRRFSKFLPYPCTDDEVAEMARQLRETVRSREFGAILVEPIQARGGIRIPHADFLPLLRDVCDQAGMLLVLDEIYTGFGRTGRWFACEHPGTVPDLICLGKALTGGFPLSACVGRADLMDAAWPPSDGEAVHTSTFLGHPVGCAMALASIGEIRRLGLVAKARDNGALLLQLLREVRSKSLTASARGLGLLAGLQLDRRGGAPAGAECLHLIKRLLHAGFVFLPEGEHSNVLGFTPPLTISEAQLRASVRAVERELRDL